jgi:hypothetical protein
MGITKNQLKLIVKECLVEILAEGIGQNAAALNETLKKTQRSSSTKAMQPSISTVLQQSASRTKLAPSNLSQDAIKEAIKREAGGNSVMADILADTASNTLQTMLESDRSKTSPLPPTGTVERLVAAATPDQLFGEEAASKWAALAFMDPIKK